MTDKRPPSSDPKGLASMQVRASETAGSYLAHWPPPLRGQISKPTLTIHQPNEPFHHHAKTRGWRLTRAMFAEFEEDES